MTLKAHVNRLFFIAITIGLSACNNSTQETDVASKDTTIKNTTSDTETISEINISNIDTLPKQINYEGKLVDAKMWKDKTGEHYAFVTGKKQGEYLTENWLSKLNGYMYTKTSTGFMLGWQVKDNASISSEVNYLKNSLTIKDIDNDGEAEVWFFYSFNEDGADPMPMKMILYSKDKKLAIRGTIPRSITDLNLYKKSIDATGINKAVEDYASQQWDKVATEEMKRIIGEDVTQSKDFPIKSN